MSLRIETLTEDDLPAAAEIENAAFEATSAMHFILHPNGTTPFVLDQTLRVKQQAIKDPNVVCKKVVDTELGSKMVAFGMWRIWREDEPPEEAGVLPKRPSLRDTEENPDVNPEAWAELNAGAGELNKLYIRGKKRIHLGLFVTHPDHQRRGAGKMLLDWAASWADEESLQTTVTASPIGLPLYRREGFEVVEGASFAIDMSKWGGKGEHRNTLLRRLPKPKANLQ